MSEIRIVAEMEVLPEHRDALMPVLQALVDGSRGEAGNISYELTQDLSNVYRFFVIETWASQQAIDEHNVTPHFRTFVAFTEGKLKHMSINLLKKVF
ncbi:MAG: putative quinol monooxygenase [Desulfovibrio sp.]|nr:putative quinol monooxygenase [Desulfovibrio sp.]